MVIFGDIFKEIRGLSALQKKDLYAVTTALFLSFFSYPIVRSTVDALFLNRVGAAKSPLVWLFSVIGLVIAVSFYSYFQKRLKIHGLYLITTIFTLLFFAVALTFFQKSESVIPAYALFIWKEIYMVLFAHMALGHFNTLVDREKAKILYGPMGATGGLAGIIGGYLTGYLTMHLNEYQIIYFGLFFLIPSLITFWFSQNRTIVENKSEVNLSPLKAVESVSKYVFMIALMIALSQFCINLANFKFNILLEQIYPDRLEKTRILGNLYGAMGMLTLFIQLFITPLALKYIKGRSIGIFIPALYLLVYMTSFSFGGFISVAGLFIVYKGVDYSIFGSAKEILYFPLNITQRYGAKYIVDMVVYRLGKGVISVLLIFVQIPWVIDMMSVIFLVSWILLMIPLFKEEKRILGS